MDDFGVAFDGLNCPLLNETVIFGYLIGLELMDEQIDVVYFVLNILAVLLYDLEVKIVIVNGLVWYNVLGTT